MTGRLFESLWLIGCGNMAGAMLRRWLAVGMDPAQFLAVRPSGAPVAEGVKVVTAPEGPAPAIAILGFKPQQLEEAAAPLPPLLGRDTLLISLLAGVTAETLRACFPDQRIVRAMPNMPVALGKGAVGLHAPGIEAPARERVASLMAPLGLVEWIDDEQLFDVVAALTASGPAFVFRFIDALAEGAASLGLPADQAQRLAVATVEGAAALASASDLTPRALAEQVASPGGMTREGLNVLDADEALRGLVESTLEAAVRRSRALGQAARKS